MTDTAGSESEYHDAVNLNITSEYDTLRKVLVHEPGHEIDRLTPENKSALLFEDIPYLPKMKMEHQAFVEQLESEGVEVVRLRDLLRDILRDEAARAVMVRNACSASLFPALTNVILDFFSEGEIADILLGGITASELTDRTGRQLASSNSREDPFLISPVPNAYFTRDPAAAVGRGVVSCKMHYRARIRESLITREIFRRHPALQTSPLIFGDTKEEDRPFTIEGGDVIVLSSKAVAVGCSERTRSESIALLATRLFERGYAQRVYEVTIPSERAYMHLDTVFTVIDQGLVVAYPDVMSDVKEIRRYEPLDFGDGVRSMAMEENRTFNEVLEDEFGGTLEVIHTGNNVRRYAAREQQADGTNVLAIAPSVVITYNRNEHTNRALAASGVRVIEIEGSELVRGLGGPRCMTMPLARQFKDSDA